MFNRFKPQSEFNRNILTLMTGTTIAQAIPIAVSPILTRLYTPDDFGLYAFFMAIATILGSISAGRYELAIMLPKKEEEALNILATGFIITLGMGLFSLTIVLLFSDKLVVSLHNPQIAPWLYFIPIVVFFTGLYNLLIYFNNRKKLYKDIAHTAILKSITMTLIQVIVGFVKNGIIGLIGGLVISLVFGNMRLAKNILFGKRLLYKITKVKMIALAKKYRHFPIYSMPAVLTNTLSVHLINILISTFYSIATLGFYSLVQRVLAMPSTLIGNAIGQVFLQQATLEKQCGGDTALIFRQTLKKLIVIGLPLFILLFFSVETIFTIVFGETWQIAGTYAKILVPLFFIRFLSSTLSSILIVCEKQKNELLINLVLIVTSILPFFFVDTFFQFLYVYTFIISLDYFIFLIYYYNLSKGYK